MLNEQAWWQKTLAFIETLNAIPFGKPDGKPLDNWIILPYSDENCCKQYEPQVHQINDGIHAIMIEALAGDAERIQAWGDLWDIIRSKPHLTRQPTLYSHVLNYIRAMYICDNVQWSAEHKAYIEGVWQIWCKGYEWAGYADGKFYVFANVGLAPVL